MHIRTDDTVQVISGDDRGVQGRVISVNRDDKKVIVEGINKITKHVHKSQKNPQGGRLSKEAPLDVAKLMLVCPSCNKPSRVGKRLAEDGSKVRFCKKCDANIGVLLPPKK